jgi:hypothetical protein
MDWLSPVFGLLGVIVGGVLTAYTNGRSDRQQAMAAARSYAVLIRDELQVADHRIKSALESEPPIWGAVLDPGLPYAAGLWAVEHREGHREESVWPQGRDKLAPFVSLRDWEAIAYPFLLIAMLSDRQGTWTNDPNRAIPPESRRDLETLRQAIHAAQEKLGSVINQPH